MDTPWMSSVQAAAYLGVSVHQLHHWAQTGEGPKRHAPRWRVVRYHRDDLDAWIRGGLTEGHGALSLIPLATPAMPIVISLPRRRRGR